MMLAMLVALAGVMLAIAAVLVGVHRMVKEMGK